MIPIGETKDGRSDYTNFEMDLIDTRMLFRRATIATDKRNPSLSNSRAGLCRNTFLRPSCFPLTIVVAFVLLVVLLPLTNPDFYDEEIPVWEKTAFCNCSCEVILTESIPENLQYPPGSFQGASTFEMWKRLLEQSKRSLDLTVFYWSLLSKDMDPSGIPGTKFDDSMGKYIYDLITETGSKGVQVRIVQNLSKNVTLRESLELEEKHLATVRTLNFTKFFGAGVLHTKMWIVDNENLYMGSANMDWRSLTQVKELGLSIFKCPSLSREAKKIFDVLYEAAPLNKLPTTWNFKYAAKFNKTKPLKLYLNGVFSSVYLASSPPNFSPKHREHDLSAIKDVMSSAEKFIHISVMDYGPELRYIPRQNRSFWPDLDNHIRKVAFEKNVQIRLLISKWDHTKEDSLGYLKSLQTFNCGSKRLKIEAKWFIVPSTSEQKKIPFARVNHNKYMVTDNTAYIGTSNWLGDYFTNTAGASIVIKQNQSDKSYSRNSSIVVQLQNVFLRDWNSEYSRSLDNAIVC